jgi:hypothetical protein
MRTETCDPSLDVSREVLCKSRKIYFSELSHRSETSERGIARNILQYIAAIYCSVAMQYCNDCAVSIATIVHVPLNRNTESKKRLANGARAAQE